MFGDDDTGTKPDSQTKEDPAHSSDEFSVDENQDHNKEGVEENLGTVHAVEGSGTEQGNHAKE